MANFNLMKNVTTNKEFLQDRHMSILEFNDRVLSMTNRDSTPLIERLNFIQIVENNIKEFLSVRIPDVKDSKYLSYKSKIEDIHKEMNDAFYDTEMDLYDALLNPDLEEDKKTASIRGVSKGTEFNDTDLYMAYSMDMENWHCSIVNGDFPEVFKLLINAAEFHFFFKLIPNQQVNYFNTGNSTVQNNNEMIQMLDPDGKSIFSYMLASSNNMEMILSALEQLNISVQDIIWTPESVLRIKTHINKYKNIYSDFKELKGTQFLYSELDNKNPPSIIANIKNEVSKNKTMMFRVPYQSYENIVNYIKELCTSSTTKAVYISLYRVSSIDSEIVNSLCIASKEYNIKVFAYIESLARGDEYSNRKIIKKLKLNGVFVLDKFLDYKIHAKLFLAITSNGKFAHIGTGNYNEKTSKLYTDTHILTNDIETCENIQKLFKYIFGSKMTLFKSNKIFFSPFNSKAELLNAIDNEIAKKNDGKILIKCNSLCDTELIEKLRLAGESGVNVRVIVRTANALIPTENIQVKSKVGRYLEHDRIYWIGDNIYIASADLLFRNMDKRIECIYKIDDQSIKNRLEYTLKSIWTSNIHYIDPIDCSWKI